MGMPNLAIGFFESILRNRIVAFGDDEVRGEARRIARLVSSATQVEGKRGIFVQDI